MRVTEGLKYLTVSRQLGALQRRHAEAARRASSGQAISAPSDDPITAAEQARLRAAQSRTNDQRTTIGRVLGDAELAESMLGQAGDLLARAKEIALQGANGTLNDRDRELLAVEVSSLREELVRIGNTRGSRGSLFAGSKLDGPAFDVNGAFLGDDIAHQVDLGGSAPTSVSSSGARAFTAAGGQDVFAALADLEAALQAGDSSAVSASLGGLDAAHRQLVDARGGAGLVIDRLQLSDRTLEQLELDQEKRRSQISDADPFEAYSALAQLGSALERSIAVARRLLETPPAQF